MTARATVVWRGPGAPETGSAEAGLRGLGAYRSELLATLEARSDWEVELGFGKGRYLLGSAAATPGRPFLGVEIVSKYFRLAVRRAAARRLDNLILLRGEALYLISTLLPAAMARTVHVYFPDPWPKSRHHRRRLLDPRTVDLVLSLLEPSSGRLCFATDHVEYGEAVVETLEGHPAVELERLAGGWPEGPRTNYEAKFAARGRRILRLVAGLRPGAAGLLHPAGREAILVAPAAADQPESRSRTSS